MRNVYEEIGDYALRTIIEEDLPQLLAWRNSPEIHSKMLTDHLITWDEHLRWFEKGKKQEPPLNFAFVYQGMLAGYGGCSMYDAENKTCDTGHYLGVNLDLPVDAGVCLSVMLSKYVFEKLGVRKIITEVFVENSRVLKFNQLIGAKIIDRFKIRKDGSLKEIVKIETDYDDWAKVKNVFYI